MQRLTSHWSNVDRGRSDNEYLDKEEGTALEASGTSRRSGYRGREIRGRLKPVCGGRSADRGRSLNFGS